MDLKQGNIRWKGKSRECEVKQNKKIERTQRNIIINFLFCWILSIIIVVFCVNKVSSATCNTSSESMNTLKTVQHVFSGFTTNDAYDLVVGTVSSDAYYFEYIAKTGVTATAIQRKTLSGTEKWLKAYSEKICMNGVSIDTLENNIYYIASSSSFALIVNLKTSDGSLFQTMKNALLKTPQIYSKVRLNPDETYLYFQAQLASNSLGQICKIKINVNNYFECAELTGLNLPTAISMIQNDAYFTAVESSSPVNFHLIRIDMTSGLFKWRSQVPCTSTPGSLGFSASLLNEDQSIVYTLTAVNSAANVFIQLNATDGTNINSRYKFSTSCSEGDALHKYKTKIYIIMYCGSNSLIVVHDISDLSFVYYEINGSGMKSHSFKTDSLENRMLVCGHGVGLVRSFSIITYEETLGIHFNITNSANTFTSLISTQYPVTSVATSTMIISNYPVTNTALTPYTTSEVIDSDQFLSDISYWLRDYYAYNLVHNSYIEKDINLTCSSSGSNTVTHTKIANGANPIPSWAVIDSANSKLLITTPLLTTETNFTFGISSFVTIDGKSYTRNVYLQVIVPAVPTPSTPASTTPTSSSAASSTSNSVPVSIPTIVVLSAAFGFLSITSFVNLSGSAGFWLIIGQYQLLTILPLVGAYMPKSIIDYCAGLKYFLFTENIVDPKSIFGIKYAYSYMDRTQTNKYIYEIGLESESTFVNIFSLLIVLLCVGIFHIAIIWMYILMKPFKEVERSKLRKVFLMVFRIFTFDLYLRIGICCFLFIILSSMLETYYATTKIASIVFSALMLFGMIVFFAFCLFQWYAIRKDPTKRNKSMFRNLFTGQSDNISSGLFIIFEQVRVAGLLICVSYFNSMPFIPRCILFTVCQSLFLTIIVIQRPFIRVAANIMKILNETTYLILSVFLNFLETKDRWNTTLEKIYLYLMISICAQVAVISFIDLAITVIQKYSKPNTQVGPKVNLHRLPVDSLAVESQIPPMIVGDNKVLKISEFDPFYKPYKSTRNK